MSKSGSWINNHLFTYTPYYVSMKTGWAETVCFMCTSKPKPKLVYQSRFRQIDHALKVSKLIEFVQFGLARYCGSLAVGIGL